MIPTNQFWPESIYMVGRDKKNKRKEFKHPKRANPRSLLGRVGAKIF
jgi:hypothetical protein